MTIEQIQKDLKKDLKRYRTLQQATKDEEYQLAYSMIADYIEDKLEEIENRRNKWQKRKLKKNYIHIYIAKN